MVDWVHRLALFGSMRRYCNLAILSPRSIGLTSALSFTYVQIKNQVRLPCLRR